MPRLRCLWVRSFSACRCHFWSSRQNTEMFVQSQKQDQKGTRRLFPFASLFKPVKHMRFKVQEPHKNSNCCWVNPTAMCIHMQHAPSAVRVPSALVPLHSTIIPIILPILYTCIYIYIPRNSPVHNFRSCLRKHFFTSFDLKSDVSENYRSHRSKAQAMIDQLVKKAILLPFREVRDYQRLQGSNRTRKLMPSHIITKSNVT